MLAKRLIPQPGSSRELAILAAKGESETRLAEEAADLLFHLLVALAQRGVGPAPVMDVLRARRAK
jgi:phosphoribosyl-ATP pyrophosphohydrolase